MSRLIDADARVTVQRFDPIDEEYYHDEMTVEQALDFATDEGCPPTVSAIPVEWLEQRRFKTSFNGCEPDIDLNYAFCTVMNEWQKEQEARA